jgi:hypothetical protein
MERDDPFDLDRLRVDPAQFPSKLGKPAKQWRRQYVQFPWAWIDRLQAAKRVSTWRLAVWIVYEHWRSGGQPIVLSNVLSKAEGLSRRSKWRALAELENLGLVKVKRHHGRAPRLTLHGNQT